MLAQSRHLRTGRRVHCDFKQSGMEGISEGLGNAAPPANRSARPSGIGMLETEDLILKQGSADDWRDLYRNLWSRGEVFRYMFAKPSPTAEHAMKKTAAYVQMHKEVPTEFFVYDKSTGQAIGIAGLKEMQPGVFTVTDIALCPDFHGKGYGKQILTSFLSLAFDAMGATELHYSCFQQNVVSKRLARSCGFAYTHSEEAELTKDGGKVILDCYEVRK